MSAEKSCSEIVLAHAAADICYMQPLAAGSIFCRACSHDAPMGECFYRIDLIERAIQIQCEYHGVTPCLFFAALFGASLPLSGYYLWWKRTRKRKGRK